MAAQLIAAHNAAMECYRRAMIREQTFEGRREALAQANKLSRTFTTLLEGLTDTEVRASKRSRSSTSMCMRAGRRSSARLSTRGEGCRAKIRSNPMQEPLTMHLSPRCGAKTRSGGPCRSPAMNNGRCRMHGGTSPGAPKGERNGNYKHGGFTKQAIEGRRTLNALIRTLARAAEQIE